MVVNGQLSAPAAFTNGKTASVGPRSHLDTAVKKSPCFCQEWNAGWSAVKQPMC